MSHTNTELRNIIKNHFSSKGKKLSNLSKCVNFQLKEIIEKYNIILPEPIEKIEKKQIEKKEKLDTTNHPFKLGTFDYTYEWDDDQGFYGGNFTTITYTITKITKCFVNVEYNDRPNSVYGKIINKKYKIDFSDYSGWFFTIGGIHSAKKILFKQSINTNHKYSIYLIKKVWNKYH
jgi:hypothetical protein